MDTQLQDLLAVYGILSFEAKTLADSDTTRTFLITFGNNIAKVLRIYTKRDKALVQQEIDYMRHLNQYGIPVPRIVPNLDNDYVSTRVIEKQPQHYVLMDFESGAHPKRYTPALLTEMARQQAAFHIYGREFAKTQPLSIHFTPKADLLLRFAPSGFSHCDYDATNILAQDDKVTCVLDFEGMRYVPLVSCLFFTMARIYDAVGRREELQAYLDAYQQVRHLNVFERLILRSALSMYCR